MLPEQHLPYLSMANKISLKAGIYFSHYECFGHTSRVMAVGEVFKKRFPHGNLFFIQAGVRQPKARIDQWGQSFCLPGVFMDRRNFRGHSPGAGGDARERAQRCMDIITNEKPHLLMTEFFPLGWSECRHELIPSLVKASRQGGVLWAVAGYPLLVGMDEEWREQILKLYQKIIIFSPPFEKDFLADSFTRPADKRKYLDFFDRHAPKITFAGYLLPRQEVILDDEDLNLPKPPIPKGVCKLAVLRGGGAVYPKVIAQAIRASDQLGKDYYVTVVAGPSTTMQEWYLFSTLVGKKKVNNLVLLRALGDYEGLIRDSDVCVSLASYHTAVMLLKYRKKAVLVPFEGYGPMSPVEQQARAKMLKEMIGARVLSYQDLTANTLAAAVRKAAASQTGGPLVFKKLFSGGIVLDKALRGLFGH